MGITDDPNHPGIQRGTIDTQPVSQHETYLVLSEEERAKGFTRPLRRSYVHVGSPAPKYPLRDLTVDELSRYGKYGYVKYETYPEPEGAVIGKYWTQHALDSAGKGCGGQTTMGLELSETYARDPSFYGATYCAVCRMHRPVGKDGEFIWDGTEERVGT